MEEAKLCNCQGKRVILFIYLPFLMNLFVVKQAGFNLAYLVFALQIIVFARSAGRRIHLCRRQGFLAFLFLVLFSLSLTSSLVSLMTWEVFRLSLLVYIPIFLLLILIWADNHPQETFKALSVLQMWLGTLLSAYGIFLSLFGQIGYVANHAVQMFSFGPLRIYQVIMGMPPYFRIASLTSNPNSLGMVLMVSQMSSLYLYKASLISRRTFIIAYLLQIAGLVLTQSRNAMASTLLMLVIFHMLDSRKVVGRIKVLLLTLLMAAIGYYVLLSDRITAVSRFGDGLSYRDEAWTVLFHKIASDPLLGIGFGVSGETLLSSGIAAHNIFLNITSEVGLLGLIVFLVIWGLGIANAYRGIISRKSAPDVSRIYETIFSILVSLVFHQMFENKLLVYDYFMFFWVYLVSFPQPISVNQGAHLLE